ncbi:MAG: hypothetical protein PHE50_01115 [Dehalococcoidales bacterium]|nr:hypothetical protein [Dehalococcoidales bacterium]
MNRIRCPKCSSKNFTGFIVYEADITYCLNCGHIIEDRCETPPDVRYTQDYQPGDVTVVEKVELATSGRR